MKWLALVPLAPLVLAVAACGTPPNEAVPMRDGTLRAPTSVLAAAHCQKNGLTARMIGRAPGETGVVFQCE